MKRVSISLRLSLFPALAAMTVALVAILSIFDLREIREPRESEEEDTDTLEVLRRPKIGARLASSIGVAELSEAEAMKRVEEAPGRSAIMRLWPLAQHRERLFKLLLSKDSPEDVRLFLIGRFESEAPERALAAARTIAKEKEVSQGPLLLSTYDILSRLGDKEDLALLSTRDFELHQTKTFREECRARLEGRVGGKN